MYQNLLQTAPLSSKHKIFKNENILIKNSDAILLK